MRRSLKSPPIEAHGHTLQPVAELHVTDGVGGDTRSGGGGLRLRMRPRAVEVRAPDGTTSRLTILDPERRALGAMAIVAAVTSIVGWRLSRETHLRTESPTNGV